MPGDMRPPQEPTALPWDATYSLAMAQYLRDLLQDEGHDIAACDLLDVMATVGVRFAPDPDNTTALAYFSSLGLVT